MRRFWIQSGRLLWRNPILIVLYAIGFVVLNVYMFQYTATAYVYEAIPFYLNLGQGVGLILFLLMAVLSFEFLRLERANDLGECMVDKRCWRQMQLQRVCLLLLMVVPTSLCAFLYQFIALKIYGVLTVQVAWHLGFSCLLNVCLAQMIGVFLGAVLAAYFGRPVAYVCIALFAFLSTSMAKEWVAMLPGQVGSVGYAFKWFFDLFSITVMDTGYLPDAVYGLPIEPIRWFTSLFWIFLFGAIFLWCNRTEKRAVSSLPAACAACTAAAFLADFLCGINDSTLLMDARASSMNGEYEYELAHESKEEAADFRILSYRMDLSAHRRLKSIVEMVVTPSPHGTYRFTLYQGYHITSVTDEAGNKLSYERDGHYLDVAYSPQSDTGTITIQYQGSGGHCLSNAQGIVLPGCIPWYPVAGYIPLWEKQTNTIGIHVPTDETTFLVTFRTNLPLVCNLEQTGDHTYTGTASSVTFVGGLLDKQEDAGVTYYASPLTMTYPVFTQVKDCLAQAEDLLGQSLNFDLTDQKIIYLPSVVSSTIGGQALAAVFMPDYILISNDVDLPYYTLEYLIPHKDGADALHELLIYYLEYGAAAEMLYDDGTIDQTSLPERSSITFDPADTAIIALSDAMPAYEQALRYQMKQYGASEVLRACYEYLQSDRMEDQVDFLYQLGDELS